MTKEERREYYRKWWEAHRKEQLAKRKANRVQRIDNERYTVTRQVYSHGYFSKRSINQAYEQRRQQNTIANR